MLVPIAWLKELVEIKVSDSQLVHALSLKTVAAVKEVTKDYIELDLKGYNRPDFLAMRGLAYEVAAILGTKVLFTDPHESDFIWETKKLPKGLVEIEDTTLAPLYCVAKIEGLKVEKSNSEWIKKLTDSGMRSINNVTDVTNLMMLEHGQPLHAFDASKVESEKIVVRAAKAGEKIVTLDGKERVLDKQDLLIADQTKALGIAGVMGGLMSEVTDKTSTILLEAAVFDSTNIRRTAQRHSLFSEASRRFQHGINIRRLFYAFNDALTKYQELGGKVTAITIVGNQEIEVRKLTLSHQKVNNLIGVILSDKEIEQPLLNLGYTLSKNNDKTNSWLVYIPYWRLDVEIEEDIIEDIARLYGYERIESKPLVGTIPEKIDQKLFKTIQELQNKLVNVGLSEVQTYSFYCTKTLESLGFDEKHKKTLVKIANPMSAETEYMRLDIWPNLGEVIDKNIRQGFKDIAIFEIGKVYQPKIDSLPHEEYRLSIALMNGSDNPLQELSAILNKLDIKGISTQVSEAPIPLFHPKRFIKIKKGDQMIAGMAELHPRIAHKFGIEKRVAFCEIPLSDLLS